MGCGNKSLFGETSGGNIKYQGNDLVSIEGANILERLLLGGISIPYQQILKSRIILKAGQTNYLMNHLGLGHNVTFVAIVAKYAVKSKLEIDNYITYSYVDNPTITFPMSQILTLSGNSTHRISQLYLNNPNPNYQVILDVMVATIDEVVEFSQNGPVITFSNNVFIGSSLGLTQSGIPSTETATEFYTTIDTVVASTLDIYDLVLTVLDDIDTISKSDIRIEFNGAPYVGIGITQSGVYSFSVVDTSYNLTEANLYINLIN